MGNQITINNRDKLEWEEGLTLQDVLKKMNYTFTRLVIKLNGRLIKKEEYGDTIVPQGADLKIIHMISGG
jgi:sulfur carrier protein